MNLSPIPNEDGSLMIRARLPAAKRAVVLQALNAAMDARHAEPNEAEPDDVTAVTSEPSNRFAQRRADALSTLAETTLRQGPGQLSAAERYQVVVHVTAETLAADGAGRCELENGQSLALDTVRRITCDSSLLRITEDGDGNPLDIGRKTLAEWMMRCGELLEPVYQRLKSKMLQQALIQADETPVQVLKEDKHRCYMWLYCTGTDAPNQQPGAPPNIVLYDYQPSRSGQCATDYLDGYSGYLQVDGYAGYNQTAATLVGCWAHARRKFVEARKAQPKGKTGRADWAISHIQKLYRVEAEIKDLETAEKQSARQVKTRPLLDELKAWLGKSALQVPPKMALGKAVAYTLGQWEKLERYLDDSHLSIDNNRVEPAVKRSWRSMATSTGCCRGMSNCKDRTTSRLCGSPDAYAVPIEDQNHFG